MEFTKSSYKVLDKSSELTPLMKQYWEVKNLHSDKILFFRMGDFFELFYDDAVLVAPLLGITLTSRNKKNQSDTPMCGMPHFSIASAVNKLLEKGFKIAICDQIEDPRLAKGLVKRAVTRILTPGMVYDPENVDASKPNYLACFENNILAFADLTTGEAFCLQSSTNEEIRDWLEVLNVKELIFDQPAGFKGIFQGTETWFADYAPDDHPLLGSLKRAADNHAIPACAKLLAYIQSLTFNEIKQTLRPFTFRKIKTSLKLSPQTFRQLEIFEPLTGDKMQISDTLFFSMNKTKTAGGSRRLRYALQFPSTDLSLIELRFQEIEFWRAHFSELKNFRERMSGLGDLERKFAKLSQPQAGPRDFQALALNLLTAFDLKKEVDLFRSQKMQVPLEAMGESWLNSVHSILDSLHPEELPISPKQGHIFRSGVHPQLDELILLTTDVNSLLASMEKRERDLTGISSLKIRYNGVFGYYIEITKTNAEKVPSHYRRKQTLAQAERFYTPELLQIEEKVLSAQTKRQELEFSLFEEKKNFLLSLGTEILDLATQINDLDFIMALAFLSLERNYCRPSLNENKTEIDVDQARHPVVETKVKNFVPNSLKLCPEEIFLITGPNMAGKSTLMRQMALIQIMAQIGSFVPASSAQLPIVDAILTRIGSHDLLSQGKSTFMVEMSETAEILQQASSRSLILLDELGRGTSTYDGMSLAQSLLEYLVKNVKAYTLFSTHYHELTELENSEPKFKNFHMSVDDQHGMIEFKHTLKRGPAGKSYGIHVARLAKLPFEITTRAEQILKGFEKPTQFQLPLFQFKESDSTDTEIKSLKKQIQALKSENLEGLERYSKLKTKVEDLLS